MRTEAVPDGFVLVFHIYETPAPYDKLNMKSLMVPAGGAAAQGSAAPIAEAADQDQPALLPWTSYLTSNPSFIARLRPSGRYGARQMMSGSQRSTVRYFVAGRVSPADRATFVCEMLESVYDWMASDERLSFEAVVVAAAAHRSRVAVDRGDREWDDS